MAEIKKLTKKDYFNELKVLVADRQDLVDFIDHEIELLSKKSSRTAPTKTQVENEFVKEKIVATLVGLDKFVTITELQEANGELANYSNQKISALLKQLVETNQVLRQVDKKKAYFKASV
jgi:flagellar biosynthesis/type III secretory pathway chaperone